MSVSSEMQGTGSSSELSNVNGVVESIKESPQEASTSNHSETNGTEVMYFFCMQTSMGSYSNFTIVKYYIYVRFNMPLQYQ